MIMGLVGVMGMSITAARALTPEAADVAIRAWTTAHEGAMPAAPTREEVEALIDWHETLGPGAVMQ